MKTANKPTKTATTACSRCAGTGSWFNGDICYRCNGNRIDPTARTWQFPADWTEQQRSEFVQLQQEKAERRREAAAARKDAKRSSARITYFAQQATYEINEGLAEALPVLMEMMEQSATRSAGIVRDTADLNIRKVRDLSEKQLSFLLQAAYEYKNADAIAAEKAEALAKRSAAPCGKVTVVGTVLSLSERHTEYGVTYKMMVETVEGWRCYGTIPSSIDPQRGEQVQFTATLEASADDKFFAFFKRPTKAIVISAAAN